MRLKRCVVDLGCCLEIMKIFFWNMCNAKECIELKNVIIVVKSPFGKCAMQKNALNSKILSQIFNRISFKLGFYLENVAMK